MKKLQGLQKPREDLLSVGWGWGAGGGSSKDLVLTAKQNLKEPEVKDVADAGSSSCKHPRAGERGTFPHEEPLGSLQNWSSTASPLLRPLKAPHHP